MDQCMLCPRNCGVDRDLVRGICLAPVIPIVAKVMLHLWEEPFLTGGAGSGAIFFSGCNLRCVYCQNKAISHQLMGRPMADEELIAYMFRLKNLGAANINLVTATHFSQPLARVLREARSHGMDLPILWNSSAYESVETLKELDGLVDIYLPDFKYMDPQLARRYSKAGDYPEMARLALAEMVRQTGPLRFSGDQLIRGTVVRHLVLPGQTADSQSVLTYLHETFGDDIFISIMNQYIPTGDLAETPELDRHVTAEEYEEVVDFAIALGIENALVQDADSQTLDFTPDFNVLFEEVSP